MSQLRRRLSVFSVPVLLLALRPAGAWADDIDIKPETEVRVTTSSGPPVSGTFVGATEKTIMVRHNGEHVDFPLADVERLEVMNPGRKAHYPEMLLAGAASGALIGAALGCASNTATYFGKCPDSEVKAGAAVGAVLGAIGGYFTSRYAIKRDPHWEDVKVRPRIRVGAMPVRQGFRLTVSAAF